MLAAAGSAGSVPACSAATVASMSVAIDELKPIHARPPTNVPGTPEASIPWSAAVAWNSARFAASFHTS